MEALIEVDALEFDLLNLAPKYDPETNNFDAQMGVPVRQVEGKRLPSSSSVSNNDPFRNKEDETSRFDVFTGLVDGITGEPLHGVRIYRETGQIYEGPFRNGGQRHGKGAIVKNFKQPSEHNSSIEPLSDTLENNPLLEMAELVGARDSITLTNLVYDRANFFGTYLHDEPSFGTLVTDTFTYRGSFHKFKFSGMNGELIHTSGYRYKGEWLDGLFHGTGREYIPGKGEYQGEFRFGVRHGMGTYKEGVRSPEESDEEVASQLLDASSHHDAGDIQARMDDLFSSACSKDWNSKNESNEEDDDEHEDSSMLLDATATHPKQYTYSGYWNCNMRQGEGTEWDNDGCVYTGQFLQDTRHGHGTLKTTQDGITYEGRWRAGEAVDGNGWRILFENGDMYTGHVINYLPDGYGTYATAETGQVYSGQFRMGQRHGHGIQTDANGAEFCGTWEEDVQVSKKRLEETDGTLSEIAEQLRINPTAKDEETGDGIHGETEKEELSSSTRSDEPSPATGESTSEEDSPPNERGQATPPPEKHDKQLAFLKQALAQSIETSLHIIALKSEEQRSNNDASYTTFEKEKPIQHRKRTPRNDEEDLMKRTEIHTYANGDTYLGALDPVSLQRRGYGVYVSKSTGCTYTGQFHRNLRHGYGILIHNQFGKYAGDFVNDRKHGNGTLILSDASSYNGGFRNGAFEGKGTLCERDGTVYVGDWVSGVRHGEGMETVSTGGVYKGSFQNGKREGQGTLLEKRGGKIVYSGHWRDGRYHGSGILLKRLVDPETRTSFVLRYEGDFANGFKHGYGVLTTEATTCKGIWSKDEPVSGKWRLHYADGNLYSGHAQVKDHIRSSRCRVSKSFVVATPDGFGTMKYSNGDVYAGQFDMGTRWGSGTCVFGNGAKWEGDWLDDRPDNSGFGILTTAEGEAYRFEPTTNSSMGTVSSLLGTTTREMPTMLQDVYLPSDITDEESNK